MKNVKKIAILGGGPAGLAAAAAMVDAENAGDLHIELFEATGRLGGRATSFVDPVSGVTLDTCQHVLMGCCTATLEFFKAMGLLDRFDVYDRYHFFDASGRCHDFAATRGLPAPLHLLPGFWRLKYLTRSERLQIMRSLRRLQKLDPAACREQTVGDWLREEGHSANACKRFWAVVLTGALSETLDRASLGAARKVFVDGFLRSRDAYRLWVPREPLGVMLDQTVGAWLEAKGVVVHRKTAVRRLVIEEKGTGSLCPSDAPPVSAESKGCLSPFSIETVDGQTHAFDQVIAAVPWRRLASLGVPRLVDAFSFPSLTQGGKEKGSGDKFPHSTKKHAMASIAANKKNGDLPILDDSPITAIHLWFDRPVSDLPHAVLVDQGGNWMFRPPWAEPNYAQVVISESRSLLGLSRVAREAMAQRIAAELVQTVSKGEPPQLLRHHTITHPRAVFSITPESYALRPEAQTSIENLYLAGDWTATGWPSTIEGAVRSGITVAKGIGPTDC